MKRSPTSIVLLILVCGAVTVGCGGGTEPLPELGTVSGTVTLDDAPLAGAGVVFTPETGRISNGTTDAEGKYVLSYGPDVRGAVLGKHSVAITVEENMELPADQQTVIPPRYNVKTTLSAEVKAGENTFDFPLKSK